MAYRTPVNSQITDAVTQSSVSTLAGAPAMAMGMIYQASAHSIGILFQIPPPPSSRPRCAAKPRPIRA